MYVGGFAYLLKVIMRGVLESKGENSNNINNFLLPNVKTGLENSYNSAMFQEKKKHALNTEVSSS